MFWGIQTNKTQKDETYMTETRPRGDILREEDELSYTQL